MTDLRILVCDDHPVYRDGLSMLLGSIDGLEVVGVAADGLEAVQRARELRPDVVVMDVQMPGMNGIEATAAMLAERDQLAVLVLTMFDDDESVFAAMQAGARGYVLKGANQSEIARAVHAVASGELILGPSLARRAAAFFAGGAQPGHASSPFSQLTAREHEILDLLAAGRTNAEIAGALFLSPKTVRNNVSSVFAKLRVSGRAEAIIRARDAGLGR